MAVHIGEAFSSHSNLTFVALSPPNPHSSPWWLTFFSVLANTIFNTRLIPSRTKLPVTWRRSTSLRRLQPSMWTTLSFLPLFSPRRFSWIHPRLRLYLAWPIYLFFKKQLITYLFPRESVLSSPLGTMDVIYHVATPSNVSSTL
jgi:hypothetical protein